MIYASGFVVDTCTLDGNRITCVFVLPEEQGKGYGPRMMNALEWAARPYGIAMLETSNPAKELYLHCGYRVIGGKAWRVESHCGFPAFQLDYETMEKDLSNGQEDGQPERVVKRALAETIRLHVILAFELASCLAHSVEYNVFKRCWTERRNGNHDHASR